MAYPGAKVSFHGEASLATATDADFTLYNTSGTKAAITIGATDQVVVTDYMVATDTAGTVTIYDGANTTVAGGETIVKGPVAANGGFSGNLATPHYCQVVASNVIRLKSSAAATAFAVIHGYIRSA